MLAAHSLTSDELLILVNTVPATHIKRWERKHGSGVAASNKRSKPHMPFLCTNTRAEAQSLRGKVLNTSKYTRAERVNDHEPIYAKLWEILLAERGKGFAYNTEGVFGFGDSAKKKKQLVSQRYWQEKM